MPEGEGELVAVVVAGEGDDLGLVDLILRGAPLCEYDGDMASGVGMTPEQARELAQALNEIADEVQDDENSARRQDN